jgi:DNA repair photolyase
VGNALELLDHELQKKRKLPPCVHLCLSTDPFMVGHPEIGEMSLEIIERLNHYGARCSVLTKGILPNELANRQRFPCDNTHGISLVSLDEGFRRQWEPGASTYAQRISALRELHDVGRRTLVHIEPYPTPNIIEQDLGLILEAVSFVDHIFFSGWNYNPRVSKFRDAEGFYRQQSNLVRQFCTQHGIECEVV